MALTKCKECGQEVSDKAASCPKCGAQLRKPQRSLFGKLIKWTFIGFNILMLAWLITGVGAGAEVANTAADEYEQAGAAIGTGLGAMMIIGVWVAGDVILGLVVLFTRPK